MSLVKFTFALIFSVTSLLVFSQESIRYNSLNYKVSRIVSENPDSIYYYTWDNASSTWNRQSRYTYEYSSAHLLHEITSKWQDEAWLIENKLSFSYENGQPINERLYWWDWFFEEWIKLSRIQNTYDSVGNITSKLHTKWIYNSTSWLNDSLIIYNYNTSGLSEMIAYKWELNIDQWEEVYRKTFVYDSANNKIQEMFYTYNFDLDNWKSDKKILYKNNENGKCIEQTTYIKGSKKTDWLEYRKSIFSYLTSGLLNKHTMYVWANIEGNYLWFEDYKYNFEYNDEYSLLSLIGKRYDWESLLWDNDYLEENQFNNERYLMSTNVANWVNGNWLNKEQFVYNYPGFIGVRSNFETNSVTIFPNPVVRDLHVKFSENIKIFELEIFNIHGERCMQFKDDNTSTFSVNLSGLNNGLYVLKINSGKSVSFKRIIIQK